MIKLLGVPVNAINLISWTGDADDFLTGWSSVYIETSVEQEAAHLPVLDGFGNYIILSIAMSNSVSYARGQLCFVRGGLYYRFKESDSNFGQWIKL